MSCISIILLFLFLKTSQGELDWLADWGKSLNFPHFRVRGNTMGQEGPVRCATATLTGMTAIDMVHSMQAFLSP